MQEALFTEFGYCDRQGARHIEFGTCSATISAPNG
jgi:hypothetical protein